MDVPTAHRIAHKHYLHRGETATITELSQGVENHNFLVAVGARTFVLRIYNQANSVTGVRTGESIGRELEFMRLARSFAIPTPIVLPTNNGDLVASWQDAHQTSFFAAFTFIEHAATRPAYALEMLPGLVMIVEGMYKASQLLPTGSSVTDDRMPFGIISRALARYDDVRPKLAPSATVELVDVLQTETAALDLLMRKKASRGYIHGDLKLENILFAQDDPARIAALLDFDDYRYSYRVEDLALLIMRDLGKPDICLLQSGLTEEFVGMIKLPELKQEVNEFLKPLLRARLMYDVLKLLHEDNRLLAEQILHDKYVCDLL